MSDLAATNCGCNDGGCNSLIWLIILLALLSGNNGIGLSNGNGCCDNSCLWLILLLCCCGGNGNGFF